MTLYVCCTHIYGPILIPRLPSLFVVACEMWESLEDTVPCICHSMYMYIAQTLLTLCMDAGFCTTLSHRLSCFLLATMNKLGSLGTRLIIDNIHVHVYTCTCTCIYMYMYNEHVYYVSTCSVELVGTVVT